MRMWEMSSFQLRRIEGGVGDYWKLLEPSFDGKRSLHHPSDSIISSSVEPTI